MSDLAGKATAALPLEVKKLPHRLHLCRAGWHVCSSAPPSFGLATPERSHVSRGLSTRGAVR
jgi:hypothetical protein